jgi:transcriptional regulator with XRE-family HTH domain
LKFGTTVRDLRQKKGYSLRDLSAASGCSISFLSQLERDLVSPTVANLKKIADALGVTVTSFFADESDNEEAVVVRKNERIRLASKASKVVYESLKAPQANSVLEPLYQILEEGAYSGDENNIHLGEEFVIVLKGRLEIFLDEKSLILNEGDSAVYNSNTPHRWRNCHDGKTELLWVNTPPTF